MNMIFYKPEQCEENDWITLTKEERRMLKYLVLERKPHLLEIAL
jgi:hypothetical protein